MPVNRAASRIANLVVSVVGGGCAASFSKSSLAFLNSPRLLPKAACQLGQLVRAEEKDPRAPGMIQIHSDAVGNADSEDTDAA